MKKLKTLKPEPPKKPQNKITVFLLKDSAPKNEECLTEKAKHIEELIIAGKKAEIFIFETKSNKVKWASFLSPVLSAEAKKLFVPTKRVSALLFITKKVGAHKRRFVFSYGYASHRLADTVYETDFGKDACINITDTDNLSSVDEQLLKNDMMKSRKQASRNSAVAFFEFNPFSIITRITGKPRDETLGNKVTGGETFVANPPLLVDDLPAISETIHSYYKKKPTEEVAEWANRIERIIDPETIERLDKKLLLAINKESEEGPELSPPQIIEWEDIEEYSLTGIGRGGAFEDWPTMQEALERIGKAEVTIEELSKLRKIVIKSGDGKRQGWSVYRCLTHELKDKGDTYALANGNWYCISSSFQNKIDKALKISNFCPHEDGKSSRAKVENFIHLKEKEEKDFNLVASESLSAALYDRKLHRFPWAAQGSKVEPCDILTKQNHFIHVKKYNGSSSLSHLFFQATVAAECLDNEPLFRKHIREKEKKNHPWLESNLAEQKFKIENFTTVFGIISKNGRNLKLDDLPIFSKIALAQSLSTLKSLRMPAKIWFVKSK